MKIAIVVGTRPEIIKMAPVVRACVARKVPHLLVHTGQRYSFELDGVFFEELGLPPPRHNLAIGSGTSAYQIAAVMAGLFYILFTLAKPLFCSPKVAHDCSQSSALLHALLQNLPWFTKCFLKDSLGI